MKPITKYCLLLLLIGCTFTKTKSKVAEFKDINRLNKEIGALFAADGINIIGKENTTNGETSFALEITVTNARNLPDDDELRMSLGKAISKRIKYNLKDSSEYSVYTVAFVKKVVDGGVTKSTSKSYQFNSEELSAPYMNVGKKLTAEYGFVYGGSIFTTSDSVIISVLKGFRISDSSDIKLRLLKAGTSPHDLIVEEVIKLPPDANVLKYTMKVDKIYKEFGTGKFRLSAIRKDTLIGSTDFELK